MKDEEWFAGYTTSMFALARTRIRRRLTAALMALSMSVVLLTTLTVLSILAMPVAP